MALSAGTFPIGPDTGTLRLRTSREGVAAKVGHDLLIELAAWSGTVTLAEADPASAKIEVQVEMGSITILEGTGGVLPLSDRDRTEIVKSARKVLDVDAHPTATFTSTSVQPADGGGSTIEGTFTVRGESAPLTITVVADGDSTWRGTGTIRQSAHGIKPYRAFLGALRLADPVAVEVGVRLAAG
jgi:polyisoprenoid-binding protein YceI